MGAAANLLVATGVAFALLKDVPVMEKPAARGAAAVSINQAVLNIMLIICLSNLYSSLIQFPGKMNWIRISSSSPGYELGYLSPIHRYVHEQELYVSVTDYNVMDC